MGSRRGHCGLTCRTTTVPHAPAPTLMRHVARNAAWNVGGQPTLGVGSVALAIPLHVLGSASEKSN